MDVGGPKVPQIQPEVNVETSNPSDSAPNPSDLPQNGHKKTPNPSDLTRNGHRRTPNSSDSPPNPSDSPQNGHWGRGGDVKPLRFDPQILQIYPKMDMGGGRDTPHRFTPRTPQICPKMDTGGPQTQQIHPKATNGTQNPSDPPHNGHWGGDGGGTPHIRPQNPSDLPQNGHGRTPNPTDSP